MVKSNVSLLFLPNRPHFIKWVREGGVKIKKYKNKRQRMYDFRREKILAGADFCSKILRHEKIEIIEICYWL
jgi:hypothetical protein